MWASETTASCARFSPSLKCLSWHRRTRSNEFAFVALKTKEEELLYRSLRVLTALALVMAAVPAQPVTASPSASPYRLAPNADPKDFPPLPTLEPAHAPVSGQPTLPVPTREGEILVKVNVRVDIDDVIEKYKKQGLKKPAIRYVDVPNTPANERTGALRWFRVRVDKGSEGSVVVELAKHPAEIEYVQLIPTQLPVAAGAPDDPCYTSQPSSCPIGTRQQPYMDFIKMPRGWDRTHASATSPSTAIAFVDSGLQSTHPDLQGKTLTGWDYTSGLPGSAILPGTGTDSGCDGGHGTGTSSIAAATTNNSVGMAGTGWDAKIIPIKWLRPAICTADPNVPLATTLYKARDLGAKVVNLSIYDGTTFVQANQDAINNLTLVYGILIVVAAGNNSCLLTAANNAYPCGYANVLCVGGSQTTNNGRWVDNSTCNFGDVRNGSNYGGEFVHVSAPAVSVVNATAAGGYAASNCCTSYAAPLVSGIGALLMASGCRGLEARQAIFDTAQANDGWTRYGPVNGAGALTRRCAPASTTWSNGNRMDLFALGKDDLIHQILWTPGSGWQGWDLPGFPVSRPAAGAGSSPYAAWSQHDGLGQGHRLDVWVEGFDNNLYQMTFCDSQGQFCPVLNNWSSWNQMTGVTAASTPAIAARRGNNAANLRQDLFTRAYNTSNFFEQPWTPSTGYTGWNGAPGGPASGSKSEPSAQWWGSSDNLLDIFVLGDDGNLYQNFLINSDPITPAWFGWSDRGTSPGGLLTSSPYVTGSSSATHLDALALAANGFIYHTYWTGAAWTWGPTGLGQPAAGSGPTATWRGTTRIEAFFLAADGNIYQSSYVADAQPPVWTNWGIVVGVP